MAIAVDVANLGTGHNGGGSSVTITTGSAVATGGFIVACAGHFGSTAQITSVSGGGLAWTIDLNSGSGGSRSGIVSAQAPSGLPSSTVITISFADATPSEPHAGAMSFTGVKTSSPVDGSPPATTFSTSVTTWVTNSVTLSAGSVLCGFSLAGDSSSSSPTAPTIEAWEISIPANPTVMSGDYRIEPSAGSYTLAGTFGATTDSWAGGVAYLAAPTATATQIPVARHGLGLGRW